MPTTEEFAYIAGFIDGEGAIGIHAQKKKYGVVRSIRVVVTNSDPIPLKMIQDLYGGSLHSRSIRDNWKISWTLFLSAHKAYNLLKDIRPYLKIKDKQAVLCLLFQEKRTRSRKKEDRVWDAVLTEAMTSLNRKGR
uniref:Putative homing endonuclease n=1 Tax=viral metagenome TaxID=1070528 RepID=A0A6M3KK29_9ZZZZ